MERAENGRKMVGKWKKMEGNGEEDGQFVFETKDNNNSPLESLSARGSSLEISLLFFSLIFEEINKTGAK